MLLSSNLIRPKATRWCFTHNNPAEDDEDLIIGFFTADCKYAVFGREVGASGTPHLQGFFILDVTGSRSLDWVRNRFPISGVHFEVAKGTSSQASTYCKKDGDFYEFGVLSDQAGKRNDLDSAFEWGREFLRAYGRAPTSPEIIRSGHFSVYIRNARFRPALMKMVDVQKRLVDSELRDWQVGLKDELLGQADERKIIFYVDSVGNSGKSWFCRWMLENHSETTQILSAGKEQDLAYMIEEYKHIFLFDISRGRLEFMNYSILEMIKNGYVQSTKYASAVKQLPKAAHVVVFTNEHPDLTKLSEDRYDVREI